METYKGEPHMNTKMSPSLQNTIPAQGAKKKIPLMSRSNDLQLTYLQQFRQYPLPLVLLPQKPASQLCQSPQPLPLKYNPVPFLKEQVHQEEAHQEEEGETLLNQPLVMENPWACCPPYLKGITLKLRAFSESSLPISLLTMMSQHLPPSSKESPLPSHVLRDRK